MKNAAAVVLLTLFTATAAAAGVAGAAALKLLCASLSTAILAGLTFMYRRPFIFAVPLIPAVITFVLTESLTMSAIPLILPLPAAVIIAVSAYAGENKSRIITASSIALACSCLLLLLLYRISGGVFPTYDSVLDLLRRELSSITVPSPNGRVPALRDEAILSIAQYLILCSPAIAMICLSAFAYITSSLFSLLCSLFSFGDRLPEGARKYIPSVVSAVLYLLAYLISASLVSVASADVVGYTAENLLLALLPAMMIHGERSLYELAYKHERRLLFVIVSVLILLISPSIYLMFVSFSGAIALIYGWLKPKFRLLLSRLRGDDNDNDNNDDDDDDGFYYD